MEKQALPRDIRRVVEVLLQGMGEIKLRVVRGEGSLFDRMAIRAVEEAKTSVCRDVQDPAVRRALSERVLFSVSERIPYSHMGECFCCENRFYSYRRELCLAVAKKMEFI